MADPTVSVRQPLVTDVPVRWGSMQLDPRAVARSGVDPAQMLRNYRISDELLLSTRPMVQKMQRGDPMSASWFSMKRGGPGGETAFTLTVRPRQDERPGQYLHLLSEPEFFVRDVHPGLRRVVPPLGVVVPDARLGYHGYSGSWFALHDRDISATELGRRFSRWMSEHGDELKFGPEAIAKAARLLESTAARLGFKIDGDIVKKGAITVSRRSLAFELNGSFRCLTSDFTTPKDDQVVQKLLTTTNKGYLSNISTLSATDVDVIAKAMGLK